MNFNHPIKMSETRIKVALINNSSIISPDTIKDVIILEKDYPIFNISGFYKIRGWLVSIPKENAKEITHGLFEIGYDYYYWN